MLYSTSLEDSANVVRNHPKPTITSKRPKRLAGRLCQAYSPTQIGTATIDARARPASAAPFPSTLPAVMAAATMVAASPAMPITTYSNLNRQSAAGVLPESRAWLKRAPQSDLRSCHSPGGQAAQRPARTPSQRLCEATASEASTSVRRTMRPALSNPRKPARIGISSAT